MWLKLTSLLVFSSAFIAYGTFWYRRSLGSDEPYDLKEDLKLVFLTPYLGRRLIDRTAKRGRVTRIAPLLWIAGGVAILIIGLAKILS